MRVMAIIPARSGSKGIKDKNVRLLAGFPLIAYAIAVAKLCKSIDRIVVSTDSEHYASIARSYGGEVPFIRPSEISKDSSRDIEYLQHALAELRTSEHYVPDYIALLRPTTPIREPKDIEGAIKLLVESNDCSAVVSVSRIMECPYKWVIINENGHLRSPFNTMSTDDVNLPRQLFPTVFEPNGYIDILRPSEIEKGNEYGDKALPWINKSTAIDIDTHDDINAINDKEIKMSEPYKYLIKNYKVMEVAGC